MLSTPAAMKAMDDERIKLSKQVVWDLDSVREQDEVAAQARSNNSEAHFGDVFGIRGAKGSELKEGDPAKKWKGRFVIRGSDVKDEYNDTAIFNGLSSSPATLEASKAVDAYGLIDGHTSSQCDAEQAYVQSRLGGIEIWVRIPKDRWPAEWAGKFRKPIVLLKLALHGHPDAGGYWESHCKEKLVAGGFTPVSVWNCMYWHSKLKLSLSVYVDDFKMSGPIENMIKGWKLIRTLIKTDEPSPPGTCLGCSHVIKEVSINGNKVRRMIYDMEQFMVQCVETYLTAASKTRDSLKNAAAPFLDGDRLVEADDAVNTGALQPIASSVLMKALYGVGMARFDLLKAVANLAKKFTKWNANCDKSLHTLICYVNSSLGLRLKGHIGDSFDKLALSLYRDADFAGDKYSPNFITGVFMALTGPTTFFPSNGVPKKQTCVSHSTPEAEIVSANAAVRLEGLPALKLWDVILERKVIAMLLGENQAIMQILKSGNNPALRHIARAHRINFAWLSDVFRTYDQMDIKYCSTHEQSADIMTKGFTNADNLDRATALIGMRSKDDTKHLYGINVIPPPAEIPKSSKTKSEN